MPKRSSKPGSRRRRRGGARVAEFGGVQRYREEGREARTLSWLHDLVADLRYGVRTLARAPLFTTASVLSLGLGIGANVAIFGLLYGVLMQPLAIPRARELTALVLRDKGEPYTSVLRRTYVALRDAPGAPRLEAVHEADDILTEAAQFREYSRVEFVEGGFFSLVGVAPSLGRFIDPDDEARRQPVVVISDNRLDALLCPPARRARKAVAAARPPVHRHWRHASLVSRRSLQWIVHHGGARGLCAGCSTSPRRGTM